MANVPVTSWDESSPAGSDNIALGDNRIREMKTQIREVIEVDHDFPSSGQSTTVGQHKQVTLQEQADIGSGDVGATILGSQTIDGKGELVYTDEDDNDVQLTNGGVLALAITANKVALMNLVYPVGSVVTLGVSTNPATLYGVGTWSAIAGRVIVGIDAGQTEFDTLNETGGSKTVNLSHTHTTTLIAGGNEQASDPVGGGLLGSFGEHEHSISSQLSSTQSVLQPYIVKYVWERTA